MNEYYYCMKYAETCNLCPKNKECERDYIQERKAVDKKKRKERKERIKEKWAQE